MKKLITIVSIIATSLIFTACGGGGGGVTDALPTSKIVPLIIEQATPVEAGYSIVESSEDAVLDIIVVGETKTVTLKEGAASFKIPLSF